jgi:hypothetical protein
MLVAGSSAVSLMRESVYWPGCRGSSPTPSGVTYVEAEPLLCKGRLALKAPLTPGEIVTDTVRYDR